MKTITTIAATLVLVIFAGTVSAQTVYEPLNDATAAQLYVDRQLTASATQCVTNVYNACNSWAQCPATTKRQCIDTMKAAKAACPGCAKKAWVLEKLEGLLKKTREEQAALRDELLGKLKELEDRIVDLENRMTNIEEWRVQVELWMKTKDAKDAEQDGRLDKDEEAIADLEGSKAHFELSGFGDFAPHISGFGAMAGMVLSLGDFAEMILSAGFGGTLDSETMVVIRGGVMFRPSNVRGLSIGLLGFGTFEKLTSDGDRELGGLAMIRYTFGEDPADKGFFLEAFGGLAYESIEVAVPQPVGSPIKETKREGAPAFNLGFGIGYRF